MKTLSLNNTSDFQTFDYNCNTFFQFFLLYRVAFMMKKYILCSKMIFIYLDFLHKFRAFFQHAMNYEVFDNMF